MKPHLTNGDEVLMVHHYMCSFWRAAEDRVLFLSCGRIYKSLQVLALIDDEGMRRGIKGVRGRLDGAW
ncbi:MULTISPECIES: hypothetical protein [unclassified Nonomuraea]|uniref:hypothetical protein n=1 Tax=unclassified Nonomuraea TaxID=2593643 RepID=UPI00340306C9